MIEALEAMKRRIYPGGFLVSLQRERGAVFDDTATTDSVGQAVLSGLRETAVAGCKGCKFGGDSNKTGRQSSLLSSQSSSFMRWTRGDDAMLQSSSSSSLSPHRSSHHREQQQPATQSTVARRASSSRPSTSSSFASALHSAGSTSDSQQLPNILGSRVSENQRAQSRGHINHHDLRQSNNNDIKQQFNMIKSKSTFAAKVAKVSRMSRVSSRRSYESEDKIQTFQIPVALPAAPKDRIKVIVQDVDRCALVSYDEWQAIPHDTRRLSNQRQASGTVTLRSAASDSVPIDQVLSSWLRIQDGGRTRSSSSSASSRSSTIMVPASVAMSAATVTDEK